MSSSSSTSPDLDQEMDEDSELDLEEYKDAMSASTNTVWSSPWLIQQILKFEGDWQKIHARSSYWRSRIDWYDSVKIYVFTISLSNDPKALHSYINTHLDDPDVQRFFSMSERCNEVRRTRRIRALANFDIKKLRVIRGTSWAIILEYAGTTEDELQEDKWNISRPENKVEPTGEPQPRFQMFCYIREGPGTDKGDNIRHVEDFIGLPTSKQIEE